MDQSHGPEGHGTRHPFVCAPTPGKVAVKAAILVLKKVFYLMESPSLRVFTPAEKPPKITVQSQQIVALLAGFSFPHCRLAGQEESGLQRSTKPYQLD